MTWGAFRQEENKEVLDEAAVNTRWEIRPGDLLISRANTSEYVGAAVLVRETRPKLLLSDKSLRLLLRETEVDGEWLNHALNAASSRRQMSAAATGTSDSMRNLSQDKIRAVRLRVPSLAAQHDIAQRIERELRAVTDLKGAILGHSRASGSLRRAIVRDAVTGRLKTRNAP